MRRRLAWAAALAALSLRWNVSAQDCPCPAMATPAAAFTEATVVFEATLESLSDGPYRANAERIMMGRWSHWRVTRAWKGSTAGAALRVFVPADCAPTLDVGGRYLVYGHPLGVNPEPTTSRCDRTRPLAQAQDDLAALGASPAPAPARADRDAGARTPPAPREAPVPRAAGGCAARH